MAKPVQSQKPSRRKVTLDASRLRDLLIYNPETGEWIWKVKRNRMPAGSRAGTDSGDGYVNISVDGTVYRSHRLAWLYMTGEWPRSQIDHEDTNRANCKWSNLRLSTQSQNIANAKIYSNNSSGHKGVGWDKRIYKWRAYIMKNGKNYHLGVFDHVADAIAAYQRAAIKMFGAFARAK